MTVCWGQNAANGELGMGVDEPKSSTKPMKNQPLINIEIIEYVSELLFMQRADIDQLTLPQHRRWAEHDCTFSKT
jgi:hypothetical protein